MLQDPERFESAMRPGSYLLVLCAMKSIEENDAGFACS